MWGPLSITHYLIYLPPFFRHRGGGACGSLAPLPTGYAPRDELWQKNGCLTSIRLDSSPISYSNLHACHEKHVVYFIHCFFHLIQLNREVRIYRHTHYDKPIVYILHYFLLKINNGICEAHYFKTASRIPFEWKITN